MCLQRSVHRANPPRLGKNIVHVKHVKKIFLKAPWLKMGAAAVSGRRSHWILCKPVEMSQAESDCPPVFPESGGGGTLLFLVVVQCHEEDCTKSSSLTAKVCSGYTVTERVLWPLLARVLALSWKVLFIMYPVRD